MVDDTHDVRPGRQRIVPGAGLGVDEHQRESPQIRARQTTERAIEVAHQCLVLGTANNAPVGDVHDHVQLFHEQVAHGHSRGDSIGVGIVVR